MDHDGRSALANGIEDNLSIHSTYSSNGTLHKQPFIMGVAHGTASGKTIVWNMIITQLRDHRVVLINQDSFYRSLTKEQLEKVNEHNFDHPDAFDTELLLSCIAKLQGGQEATIPNYDFKSHSYVEPTRKVMTRSESRLQTFAAV